MVGDLIEKIKKAEENAKNQIKESYAESDITIRKARERAGEIIEEAKKQAAEEAKLIIKRAEAEAAVTVAKLEESNNIEREKIRKIAEGNKPKVASFITRRVIG